MMEYFLRYCTIFFTIFILSFACSESLAKAAQQPVHKMPQGSRIAASPPQILFAHTPTPQLKIKWTYPARQVAPDGMHLPKKI